MEDAPTFIVCILCIWRVIIGGQFHASENGRSKTTEVTFDLGPSHALPRKLPSRSMAEDVNDGPCHGNILP